MLTRLFRRNWKKLISAGLAVCLLSVAIMGTVSEAVPVQAEDKSISQLEKERKELDKKIQSLENSLKDINAQKKAEANKQANLTSQISTVQDQIALYLTKIDMTDAAISQKEVEISDKEKEVAEGEEQFAKRVRAMYISNTSNSMLSSLLTAQSLSDLLNQTEIMKRVSESDQTMIDKLHREKSELEELKKNLEAERADLAATKNEYTAKNNSLNSLLSQSQSTESELLKAEKQYMANKEKYKKEDAALEAEIQRIIAEQSVADAYGDGVLMWPLPGISRITSPFGWRVLFGKRDFHTGVDIGAAAGTNIKAADNGKVILVKKSSTGYGWHVVIDHGAGIVTLYAHASRIDVNTGDIVQKGQTIAGVGTTGNSTGNHLHFEVRVNNTQTNPLNYVKVPR